MLCLGAPGMGTPCCGSSGVRGLKRLRTEKEMCLMLQLSELLNFLMENFVFTYIGVSLFTFRNHSWEVGFILLGLVSFAYVK